jgi:hypothetical protein
MYDGGVEVSLCDKSTCLYGFVKGSENLWLTAFQARLSRLADLNQAILFSSFIESSMRTASMDVGRLTMG